MTTPRSRTEQLEQWLRRPSEAGGAAGPDCLDAETAAAWQDGALLGEPLRLARAHLAHCSRCQSLMATLALVNEESALPAAQVVERPRGWMSWVIPLGALAAATLAIVVWVRTPSPVTPTQSPTEASGSRSAQRTEVTPPVRESADASASPALKAAEPAREAATPVSSGTGGRQEPPPASASPDNGAVRDVVIAPAGRIGGVGRREAAIGALSAAGAVETGAAPVSPQALESAPLAAPATQAADQAGNDKRAAGVPLAGGTQPTSRERMGLGGSASVAGSGSAAVAAPTRDNAVAANAPLEAAAAQAASGTRTTVIAPGAREQWRFTERLLERSMDAGVSWTRVGIDIPSVLQGGSAPASSVCWLVGRAGLVLLTADGSKWNQLRFPDVTDLVSVAARDARSASVTALDGRVFTTTDGGITWNRAP